MAPSILPDETLESVRQWSTDLKRSATVDVPTRVRTALRDTKHFALRELTIRRYLRDHQERKLQLGTGGNFMEGWLNTDLFPFSRATAFMDVTKRFPLPDASFDYIFSEHQIEHVSYPDGASMLRECFRVLRPGGLVRLATPDLAKLLSLYQDPNGEGKRYIQWITDRFMPECPGYSPVFVINLCMRFAGHQFLYDAATLRTLLGSIGFVDIEQCEPNVSRHAALNGIDSHHLFTQDEWINRFESMVFEARRP